MILREQQRSLIVKNTNLFFYIIWIFACIVINSSLAFSQMHFKVKWVNDGDTIILQDNRRVRYIGINAPEIDHDGKKGEPFGYKATFFNKDMVLSQKVRLEFKEERFDQYGRLLAYIFLSDGTFVNQKMIEKGFAYFLPVRSKGKYDNRLLKAQREAMKLKLGIWNIVSEQKEVYIGNKQSKRFHSSTCSLGQKIYKRNRMVFSTRWDAFWAGYAPAKKCINAF